MKALFALATVALFAASTWAADPMPLDVPVAAYNATKNSAKIIGETSQDVLDFVKDNKCFHNAESARCIYNVPLNGVGISVVGLARVGGELTILVSKVPASAFNFVAAGFEGCERNAPDLSVETVCRGFAYAATETGKFLVKAGHYGASSLGMQGRTYKQSFSLVASSITHLSKGKVEDSFQDMLAAGPVTGVCLVGSVVKFVFTGSGINCDEFVAAERLEWDIEDAEQAAARN